MGNSRFRWIREIRLASDLLSADITWTIRSIIVRPEDNMIDKEIL